MALLDVNVLIALLHPIGIDASRRLVSFDHRLSCEAVAGGREALWLFDG